MKFVVKMIIIITLIVAMCFTNIPKAMAFNKLTIDGLNQGVNEVEKLGGSYFNEVDMIYFETITKENYDSYYGADKNDMEQYNDVYILMNVKYKEDNKIKKYVIKENETEVYAEAISPTIENSSTEDWKNDKTNILLLYCCIAVIQDSCSAKQALYYLLYYTKSSYDTIETDYATYEESLNDSAYNNTMSAGYITYKENDEKEYIYLSVNKTGGFEGIASLVEKIEKEYENIDKVLQEAIEELENIEQEINNHLENNKLPRTGSGYGAKDAILGIVGILTVTLIGMFIYDIKKR